MQESLDLGGGEVFVTFAWLPWKSSTRGIHAQCCKHDTPPSYVTRVGGSTLIRNTRTLLLSCATALAAVALIVGSTATAAAAPASPVGLVQSVRPANTEVPCNSGPPEPIQVRVYNGGDICFGGTVGVESVGLVASFADSGGYYGYFFIDNGSQCVVQYFVPNRVYTINAGLCAIEITPPGGRAVPPAAYPSEGKVTRQR